jgi:hypothetical protein
MLTTFNFTDITSDIYTNTMCVIYEGIVWYIKCRKLIKEYKSLPLHVSATTGHYQEA